MRRRDARLAFILSALALVAACEVGPDFTRPAAPKAARYTPEPLAAKTAQAEVHAG